MSFVDPNQFIITRKRKKYKFALFHNSPLCLAAGTGALAYAVRSAGSSAVLHDDFHDAARGSRELFPTKVLGDTRFFRHFYTTPAAEVFSGKGRSLEDLLIGACSNHFVEPFFFVSNPLNP